MFHHLLLLTAALSLLPLHAHPTISPRTIHDLGISLTDATPLADPPTSPGQFYGAIMAAARTSLALASAQLADEQEQENPTSPWLLWTFQTNTPTTPPAFALLLMPLPPSTPLESYTVLGLRVAPAPAAPSGPAFAPVVATYTLAGWARRAPRPGVCWGVLRLAEKRVREVVEASTVEPTLLVGADPSMRAWAEIVLAMLEGAGAFTPLRGGFVKGGGGKGSGS